MDAERLPTFCPAYDATFFPPEESADGRASSQGMSKETFVPKWWLNLERDRAMTPI